MYKRQLLETELMKEIDDNLLTEFLEGKLDEPANREIENWYDTSEAVSYTHLDVYKRQA